MLNFIILAQDAATPSTSSKVVAYILIFTPLLLLMWWFYRNNRRQGPLMQRSMEHMDRLEAQSQEMIALLREISAKLDARK